MNADLNDSLYLASVVERIGSNNDSIIASSIKVSFVISSSYSPNALVCIPISF